MVGSLRNHDGQRQRERGETKGLISRIMARQVRYNVLSMSLPSSAKQPPEITNKILRLSENVSQDRGIFVFPFRCEHRMFLLSREQP